MIKNSLLIGALMATPVLAEERVMELVMPTDAGELILTTEECNSPLNYDKVKDFEYKVYATDERQGPTVTYEGCWKADNYKVYIHFAELGDVVMSYTKHLFKPRDDYEAK